MEKKNKEEKTAAKRLMRICFRPDVRTQLSCNFRGRVRERRAHDVTSKHPRRLRSRSLVVYLHRIDFTPSSLVTLPVAAADELSIFVFTPAASC